MKRPRDAGANPGRLSPPLGTGASPTILFLEVLLLVLAGALALLLTLTVRASPNRLAGVSIGFAAQRDHAAALLAVFLLVVIMALYVAHTVGQT